MAPPEALSSTHLLRPGARLLGLHSEPTCAGLLSLGLRRHGHAAGGTGADPKEFDPQTSPFDRTLGEAVGSGGEMGRWEAVRE